MNQIINGDCIEELKKLPDNSVDAIITDPPYGLEFMGKDWDAFGVTEARKKRLQGIDNKGSGDKFFDYREGASERGRYSEMTLPEKSAMQMFMYSWAKECLRVLKPGGFLLSFGGTRTYHRMTCGIEDAGFEIRDCIMWIYGSGFPKSLNIGKAVDKLQGNEREVVGESKMGAKKLMEERPWNQKEDYDKILKLTKENSEWEGWGTALKPAVEPIVVARKPLSEKNVALNVLKWGTGGINIDECRIPFDKTDSIIAKNPHTKSKGTNAYDVNCYGKYNPTETPIDYTTSQGRFPANIIFECICDEVLSESIEIKEPEEIKGGIWNPSQGKPAGRTYKGGNIIHTNLNCPCRLLDEQTGELKGDSLNRNVRKQKYGISLFGISKEGLESNGYTDKGGASRFFYCAKASKSERNFGLDDFKEKLNSKMFRTSNNTSDTISKGFERFDTLPSKNNHPTVKPIKLMEYLIKLVSREGATILDPFTGSGTTGIACVKLNRNFIGIEKEPEYVKLAEARIKPFLEQNKLK